MTVEHPAASADGWLSDEDLHRVRAAVPIVCVDAVPVRSTGGSRVEVGLILRAMPGREAPVWCHLGGRVRRGETLRTALQRHLETTLLGARFALPLDPRPDGVVQWFPAPPPSEAGLATGLDPRQHAVALVFAVPMDGSAALTATGEALDFRWHSLEHVAEATDLWPGTALTVLRALGGPR